MINFNADILKKFFVTGNSKNLKSYSEPLLSNPQTEELILEHMFTSANRHMSIDSTEFIFDIKRFKNILKEVGITNYRSAIDYLNQIKIEGKRTSFHDKAIRHFYNDNRTTKNKPTEWENNLAKGLKLLKKNGFDNIRKEDVLLGATAYDMLMIYYVASLSLICNYINITEYNMYRSYCANHCQSLFSSKESMYISYLLGKYMSRINNSMSEISMRYLHGCL